MLSAHFDHARVIQFADKVVEAVKTGSVKRFIVMAGCVLDVGQCHDSYSLAVVDLKLKEVFELDDVTDLPISFDIAWYEQKAVAVLLALLALGFKGMRPGSTLPAFLSPDVAKVLADDFDIKPVGDVEDDIADMLTESKYVL